MTDIELVIKIPEDVKGIIDRKGTNEIVVETIWKAVKNGIPLPKGHGRLIAEPTEEEIAKTIGGKNDFADCIRESVKTVFANAQTIIEADKGESK